MTPLGAVRSIVIVRTSSPLLLAMSYATARIAFGPSNAGVDQRAEYGEALSVPNGIHEPVEHAALAFEHSKKSTRVTSPSGVEALTGYEVGSEALMYVVGLVSVTVGAPVSSVHVKLVGGRVGVAGRVGCRTSTTWAPSKSAGETVKGLVQVVQEPPSMRHSKVEPGSLELK